MTIKDLMEVSNHDKEVFVKPLGPRTYYDGTLGDVPECLKSVTIKELVPQIYPETDPASNRRFYFGWGVWIDNIPTFDAIVSHHEDFCEFPGKTIDELVSTFPVENLTPIRDELLRIEDDNPEEPTQPER